MVVGREALAQYVRGVAELKSPRGAHAAESWREHHEHGRLQSEREIHPCMPDASHCDSVVSPIKIERISP